MPKPVGQARNPGDPDRGYRTGVLLMIVATTALGLFPTGARFAYEGGATPETVSVLRHLLTVLFLGALLGAERGGRRPPALMLPRTAMAAAWGLGLVLAVYSWAYVAAIRYIPVSLAVLLLYTFPAQVAVMTFLFGGERPGALRLLALAIAFGGIALAVGVNTDTPDWRGIGLGLLAGFGLALITVSVARPAFVARGRAFTVHMALSATVLTATAIAAGPGFAVPATPTAWGGFLFAGAAAALGIVLYFAALPMIGPVRAALLSNLEPVVAIIGALALLGERPTPTQSVGIAMVILALGLLRGEGWRRPGRTARGTGVEH